MAGRKKAVNANKRITSFAPVVRRDARVLVLGSIPGVESLRVQQYYAHPRNAFWPIMASLFQFDIEMDYADRVAAVQDSGIALWDSMHACVRPGSLDSSVVNTSIEPNDFVTLFATYPGIVAVFFNGSKSEQVYRRHVASLVDAPDVAFARLPSTSPAHASLRFADKLAAWQAVQHAASDSPGHK